MNDPTDTAVPLAAARPAIKFEDLVRQHPGSALLVAAGLGLAAVFIARAFTPPPRNRAVQVLEDIQHRLASLARLGIDGASSLAEVGAHAASKGVDQFGTFQLGHQFDKFSRGLRNLFH